MSTGINLLTWTMPYLGLGLIQLSVKCPGAVDWTLLDTIKLIQDDQLQIEVLTRHLLKKTFIILV